MLNKLLIWKADHKFLSLFPKSLSNTKQIVVRTKAIHMLCTLFIGIYGTSKIQGTQTV